MVAFANANVICGAVVRRIVFCVYMCGMRKCVIHTHILSQLMCRFIYLTFKCGRGGVCVSYMSRERAIAHGTESGASGQWPTETFEKHTLHKQTFRRACCAFLLQRLLLLLLPYLLVHLLLLLVICPTLSRICILSYVGIICNSGVSQVCYVSRLLCRINLLLLLF